MPRAHLANKECLTRSTKFIPEWLGEMTCILTRKPGWRSTRSSTPPMRMQRTVTGNVKIEVFFLQILKMILKRMIAMLCIASDVYYGAVKSI